MYDGKTFLCCSGINTCHLDISRVACSNVHMWIRSNFYQNGWTTLTFVLQWRQNGASNHRRFDGLLNRLFRRRSKKASKLHITGLCGRNSPVTGEFPSQRASNAENVSIWWRHHGMEIRASNNTSHTKKTYSHDELNLCFVINRGADHNRWYKRHLPVSQNPYYVIW